MNKENKQTMLDCSQGTLLRFKENHIYLYSVKEVCNLTGLTRKQLFDYQEMVHPAAYDKSGYKLYDEKSIGNLLLIAEMRSINVPLAKIKSLLEGKIERMDVIMNQVTALETQKRQVEEMLIKARDMLSNFIADADSMQL